MNKTKLATFFITFVILILITPLIFGKMMNSRFDSMLGKIDVNGYKIKEIKNKSSYLLTDRVFEVKIPGKNINSPQIEYIDAVVEAKFKNLPVTTVEFNGTVKNIVFKNPQYNEINRYIKNKIKFFVTTPDFKVYRYRILDNNISINDAVLTFKGINGTYKYPDKNIITISLIDLKSSTQPFDIKIKNIKNEEEKNKNQYMTKSSFDINGKFSKFDFAITGVHSKSLTVTGMNKINADAEMSFDNFNVANFIDIAKTHLNVKVNNIDKKLVEKIKNTTAKDEKQQLLLALISKGFTVNTDLNISNIKYMTQNLGFFQVNTFVKFIPTKNLEMKMRNNDFSFVDFDVNIKTTPAIAQILAMFEPKISFVLQNAKTQNGAVIIEIKKENGNIFINGRKIESD